jgi:AbiJ N-terminal domain 3
MPIKQSLAERIANVLKDQTTHAQMASVGIDIGLVIPDGTEGASKRDRARQALTGKTELELAETARRLGVKLGDCGLEEEGLAILEADTPAITEITRRDAARCFGDNLTGERDVVEVVRELFPIDKISAEAFSFRTVAEDMVQHMIRNPGDWSVENLFEQIGALSCSRDRFSRLLEAALHPLERRGDNQQNLVRELNAVFRRDGYELRAEREESGYPLYRLVSLARGPTGAPKNLIFASNGPKPEIGFSDAINNDIVILTNAESCLVYDRPIRRDGLLWSELVDWWRELCRGEPGADHARELGRRLRISLASDGERALFDNYFRLYRPTLGEALPALIPQVYLHYDPAVVKFLRHRTGLRRQRMDFLLLLPNNRRGVLEVDGTQHFSRDDKPSLAAYAEIAAADRDLRLSGYDVYRFGANELTAAGAGALIEGFFDRLWTIHGVPQLR